MHENGVLGFPSLRESPFFVVTQHPGLLKLNLNEEPLKGWVENTVGAVDVAAASSASASGGDSTSAATDPPPASSE